VGIRNFEHMKNKNVMLTAGGLMLTLVMFIGCGEKAGQKEYEKAMAAWKKGDLVRARSLLEKSIRKTSGNEKKSVVWNQLGLVLWKLGEAQAAADAFGKSCNLTESFTGANLNHGVALYQSGKYEEAEVALNNVIGEDPKNQTALATLGLIQMQKRDWAGATRELSKTVVVNPRDPGSQNALALAELHQNRNGNAAITRLKQLLAAHPDYAPALYNLGVIYDQWLNNRSEAMDAYKRYLRLVGPEGARAKEATAALTRLGEGGSVPAPKTDPAAAARFIAEGSRLYAAKDYKGAADQYLKAAQADPTQKNAHYNLSLAQYALKNYPAAVQACNEALNMDPDYADARYMLSLSYFQLRKWNDAEREAKTLQKVDAKRGGDMLKHIESARKQ
jgi:tetratricopeptide (TPR) repeat protein